VTPSICITIFAGAGARLRAAVRRRDERDLRARQHRARLILHDARDGDAARARLRRDAQRGEQREDGREHGKVMVLCVATCGQQRFA
jgi:hypothetical protein